MRSEGSHQSELISQLLYGDCFKVISKKEEWLQITTLLDQYTGWIDHKQTHLITEEKAKEISFKNNSYSTNLVDYIKSLKIPVICFPRGIKNYKRYCEIVKPDVISIDYEVDPIKIQKEIKIPVQGGLDPKILLSDKDNLRKEVKRYLDIFKNHPYIFNLGHGILPETNPNTVDYLVKMVKDY